MRRRTDIFIFITHDHLTQYGLFMLSSCMHAQRVVTMFQPCPTLLRLVIRMRSFGSVGKHPIFLASLFLLPKQTYNFTNTWFFQESTATIQNIGIRINLEEYEETILIRLRRTGFFTTTHEKEQIPRLLTLSNLAITKASWKSLWYVSPALYVIRCYMRSRWYFLVPMIKFLLT